MSFCSSKTGASGDSRWTHTAEPRWHQHCLELLISCRVLFIRSLFIRCTSTRCHNSVSLPRQPLAESAPLHCCREEAKQRAARQAVMPRNIALPHSGSSATHAAGSSATAAQAALAKRARVAHSTMQQVQQPQALGQPPAFLSVSSACPALSE